MEQRQQNKTYQQYPSVNQTNIPNLLEFAAKKYPNHFFGNNQP